MYIWKMAWQRKGKEEGKDRGIQSTMGKVRKRKEHIFKPMLIYLSSQRKQVHKGKKSSSLLRALSKSTLNSKIGDNKYRNAHWTEKPWRLSLGRILKRFSICQGRSQASSCSVLSGLSKELLSWGRDLLGSRRNHLDNSGNKRTTGNKMQAGSDGRSGAENNWWQGTPFGCRITKGLYNCVK